MDKCAYANCGKVVDFGDKSIHYCKGGCYRTLVRCPNCQAVNSALAFFCRRCRTELDFEERERTVNDRFTISNMDITAPTYSLDLSTFEIDPGDVILPPYFCRGLFMLLTKNGRVLIFNHYDTKPVERFQLPGEEIYVSPVHVSQRPSIAKGIDPVHNLYITTTRTVYKIDLLREFQREPVFVVDSEEGFELDGPLIPFGEELSLFLYDRGQNQTKVKRVDSRGSEQDIDSFRGRATPPVMIDTERAFFGTTNNQIAFYNLVEKEISLHQVKAMFDANKPVRHSNSQIYIAGDDSIFRLPIGSPDEEYTISRVPHPKFNRISFNVDKDSLLISHDNGIAVVNPLGSELWTSTRIGIESPAYEFAPQVCGKYVLITFLDESSGREYLNILSKEKGYARETSCGYQTILAEPIIHLEHLFILVEEDRKAMLKVCYLCEDSA